MPNTIAQNLARLQAAKTAIGAAITAKGGTVTAGDGLEDFPTGIATIPSGGGGGGASPGDVTFCDYDGSVVQSYSKNEFLALEFMPQNQTHDGLTAQGWNYSLADAKAYVTKYGRLNIGQMYRTTDGKTHIHIHLEDGRLAPYLGLGINGSVEVDWGDGTATDTMTGSSLTTTVYQQHTYAAAGDYVIKLAVTGSMSFMQVNNASVLLTKRTSSMADRVYQNAITELYIGSGVTSIGQSAFSGCYSLASVTIPGSVTSIGQSAFQSCYSLASVTIPDGVTSIGDSAFVYCYSLASVTIPDGVTSIGQSAFYNCSSLASVTIPDGVTSIGQSAFQNCSSLASVTIPGSVTSIGQSAFQSCYSLASVTIPDGVTSIGQSAFSGCAGLFAITIDKPESSISGSPWGATTGSPSFTQIIWTKTPRYKFSVTELTSGTSLTGTVDATTGDLVVATFVIRGETYTISEGWNLLGISNVVGTSNQRTAMAYKIASSASESLTITQNTNSRIYINLVAITGASIGTFSGFVTQSEGSTMALTKPQGLAIWGVSSSLWGATAPYSQWGISPISEDRVAIQLPSTSQPRCLTVLDQSDDESVSFTYSPDTTVDGALAAASLTITGIPDFWYEKN